MKYMLLCVLNVISLAGGQILFKTGMKDKVIDSVPAIIKMIFTPFVFSGLVLYAFTAILWLYILSKIPISRAYPIQALAYPLVLIAAKIMFNENITMSRWFGIGIIVAGIIVVAQ
jgi:drug/metabolite transporter (DMT)-like permease